MRPPQRPDPRRGRTGTELSDGALRDGFARSPLSGDVELPLAEWAESLRVETEQLKEALERRPVIDIARGVLMAVWSCTLEEAWEILVTVSQNANTKVHDIAEAVIATTQRQPMPEHLQKQLAAAVSARRARGDGRE
ncbi:ANTAR domain-containing protein [Streptomyces sp. NPDC087903]|uniref:ANTAR domain-containing protein n=1 Tax=Streptomyces sp. NPDC087903 TaxID=3365819 RepID=UPI0038189508